MVARVNVQNLSCAAALHSGLQEATSDRSNRCIALRFTVIISIEIHPAEFFDLLLATNCFSVLDVSYDLPVSRSFDTHSNGWRYEWPPSTSHTHTHHTSLHRIGSYGSCQLRRVAEPICNLGKCMIKGSITFITLHLIWHTARMRCKDRSSFASFQ